MNGSYRRSTTSLYLIESREAERKLAEARKERKPLASKSPEQLRIGQARTHASQRPTLNISLRPRILERNLEPGTWNLEQAIQKEQTPADD
jgi:hypothetical protein